MKTNLRLIFSILWLVMTGALVASIFMVVVSLGDYQEFLYAAIGGWVVVSAATLITSL